VATVLIMLGAKKETEEEKKAEPEALTPEGELRKSLDNMIWVIGLAVYFVVSFLTGAWYITWLIFPLTGAVKGLVRAILDLKEANKYEK